MRYKILLVLNFIFLGVFAQFIPNGGQWLSKVKYRAEVPGGLLFFEQSKLTYNFIHPVDKEKIHGHASRINEADTSIRFHAFEMSFLNANEKAKIESASTSSDKFNFYIGNDQRRWASNLSSYRTLNYHQIFEGIDFLFYASEKGLKYDFIVHPGANPSLVKWKYNGANKYFIENNELKINLSFSQIIEQKPYAYQEINGRKVEVNCVFKIQDGIVSFVLGDYNKEIDLVIDPLLIFSTYSGSTADNFGYTATYDEDGFLYAGSSTFDIGYPTTLGAYDISFNSNPKSGFAVVWDPFFGWINAGFSNSDVAITKYDTSGTKRIYSTYIGGSLCEVPHSLVVNSKGELVIYGTTGSNDFPVTNNAYDTTFGGGLTANLSRGIDVNYANGSDIFISKLSVDGSAMLASTYFGGNQNDGLNLYLDYNYADQMRGEVIVDANDNIYIATCSYSSGLATGSVFQGAINGTADGVIAKFTTDLTTLTWASYLGGSNRDGIYSIVLDNNNDLIVAGGTTSNDLQTKPLTVLYPTFQGNPSDGFIGKISNDGSTLNVLTYFGTSKYDQVYFVKIDRFDNIYVYGQSESMDSTLIKNANYYSVNSGMFVSKLTNNLENFIWSTTFGSGDGKVNLSPTAFMVDLCNKVYLTGWGSPNFGFALIPNYLKNAGGLVGYNGARGTAGMQVTPDAFQATTDGSDFYIMVLEDDASALSYGSFFGGNLSDEHVDGGTSRFDRKGKIYQSMCAGCGANSDMPIFPVNAVSPTNNSSNCNNGVFKMDFLIPNVIADFKANPVCASQSFTFNNTSLPQSNTSYFWDFGDGNTSTSFEPSHVYLSSGNYTVKLKLTDPTACNLADSIVKTVKVQAYQSYKAGEDTICAGESAQFAIAPAKPYNTYLWQPGKWLSDSTILNPLATPASTIDYLLLANDGVCSDSIHYKIIVIDNAGFLNATVDKDSILKGEGTTLHVTPATWNVQWSPAQYVNDPLSVNPVATPPVTTQFAVTLQANSSNCVSSDTVTIWVYDVQCNEKDIYIPNVFTPNTDGKNDILYVRGNNIKELYFTIYDRWGEKVFETTDQNKGWNGEYKNMSADPAVFVYYLKVKCAGEKEFFTKGNITVIR